MDYLFDQREKTYINRIQFLLLSGLHLEPSLLSSFNHITRLVYQHNIPYCIDQYVSSAMAQVVDQRSMYRKCEGVERGWR